MGEAVVAVCGSGHRSTIAMAVLQMLGYEVKSLAGGINAWKAAEMPVVAALIDDGSLVASLFRLVMAVAA